MAHYKDRVREDLDRWIANGLVSAENWTLRLPPDFEQLHASRLARGAALDLALAVDLALALS